MPNLAQTIVFIRNISENQDVVLYIYWFWAMELKIGIGAAEISLAHFSPSRCFYDSLLDQLVYPSIDDLGNLFIGLAKAR